MKTYLVQCHCASYLSISLFRSFILVMWWRILLSIYYKKKYVKQTSIFTSFCCWGASSLQGTYTHTIDFFLSIEIFFLSSFAFHLKYIMLNLSLFSLFPIWISDLSVLNTLYWYCQRGSKLDIIRFD